MRSFPKLLDVFFASVCVAALASPAQSTDRFFPNQSSTSPNKTYEVVATSPDNDRPGKSLPFQENFAYSLTEKSSGKTLWTRKQSNNERHSYENEEASPIQIFVSDSGWTVIRTCLDDLIAVDVAGKDRWHFEIIENGFTKEERKTFVQRTTAGLCWSGFSHFYFLDVAKRQCFIVRPWWGRRIILDLQSGKNISDAPEIASAAEKNESEFVISNLKNAASRYAAEKNAWKPTADEKTATYYAGQLNIKEAVPLLQRLENSSYSGISRSRGVIEEEGKLDLGSYSVFDFRQLTQISLRRIGVSPKALPIYLFEVRFNDFNRNHIYEYPISTIPRTTAYLDVKPGMTPEMVLAVLGSPDFVKTSTDAWEYDIDSQEPFTLKIEWEKNLVTKVEKQSPPAWKCLNERDKQITF